MRIFYDTEFLEDGHTIELISIGMVREDGKELYCVVKDNLTMQRAVEHEWLRGNVVPSLPIKVLEQAYGLLDAPDRFGRWHSFGNLFEWDEKHPDYPCVMDRHQVMRKVREFVLTAPKPELWAWYGAYDHVAIAQLFGTMAQLPDAFPMVTCDLKQEAMRLGNPPLPKQEKGKHNALADARHNRLIWQALQPNAFGGPLAQILPVPVEAPAEGEGRRDPRLWQYTIGGVPGVMGTNLPVTEPEPAAPSDWNGGWQ